MMRRSGLCDRGRSGYATTTVYDVLGASEQGLTTGNTTTPCTISPTGIASINALGGMRPLCTMGSPGSGYGRPVEPDDDDGLRSGRPRGRLR